MRRSILLAPALTASMQAQSAAGWDRVNRLVPGEDVRVSRDGGRVVQGKFQSATDDALMVSTTQSQETLSRTTLTKISTKGKNHRLRNALIGAGAGAGVGAIVGVTTDRCSTTEFFCLHDLGIALFTPAGALAGGIVGAALPTGGWSEVYRAH